MTALRFFFASACLAAVWACGGGDHPDGALSSSSGGPPGEPGPGSGSVDAGGDALVDPAACVPSDPIQNVSETRIIGMAPPAVGGAWKDGTYDLSELYVFAAPGDCKGTGETQGDAGTFDPDASAPPPDPPQDGCPTVKTTGVVVASALVVHGGAFTITTTRGAWSDPNETMATMGPAATKAFRVTASGAELSARDVCPTAGNDRVIAFSASGAALTLYENGVQSLYRLRL